MKKELLVKREMAKQIAMQCLKLNSIGDRMQGGNGPAVWFSIDAHVGAITVRVIERGWTENGTDVQNETDFDLTLWDFSDIKDYRSTMKYLKELEANKC
jgi:hypothetical protein